MMPKLVESFRKFRKFRSSAKHELRMISVSGQSQGSADRKSADSFSPGDSVRRPNSVRVRFLRGEMGKSREINFGTITYA